MERRLIVATMLDGSIIREVTGDPWRFAAIWIEFSNDPDTARLSWYALTLPSVAAAA